jgi:hypothetical protein
MNINRIKCFSVVIFLAFVGACTHTYVPTVRSDFDSDAVPKFSSNQEVALHNAQASAEPVVFTQQGAHSYVANYQECTNVVLTIAKRELANRGLRIVENNARQLKLSVQALNFDIGWVRLDSTVELQVETGSGYSAKYLGTNNSYMVGSMQNQLNAALSQAVVEMLKDPKIVEYLTQ